MATDTPLQLGVVGLGRIGADDTRARYERGLLRITLRKASPPADKVLRL